MEDSKRKEFRINRELLWEIVSKYRNNHYGQIPHIKEYYINQIISLLGNDALKEALDEQPLRAVAEGLLNDKPHIEYILEEELNMIEGLSNYKCVGDWQHYLNVKSEYLFKLPNDELEKFAQSFSIGNDDLKNCLLQFWKNRISTVSVDLARKEYNGSMNYIALTMPNKDSALKAIEIIAKNINKNQTFIGCEKYCQGDDYAIAIYSNNTDFFIQLKQIASYLGCVAQNGQVDKIPKISDSYWQKSLDAMNDKKIPLEYYFDFKSTHTLPIRKNELLGILNASSRLSKSQMKSLKNKLIQLSKDMIDRVRKVFIKMPNIIR